MTSIFENPLKKTRVFQICLDVVQLHEKDDGNHDETEQPYYYEKSLAFEKIPEGLLFVICFIHDGLFVQFAHGL